MSVHQDKGVCRTGIMALTSLWGVLILAVLLLVVYDAAAEMRQEDPLDHTLAMDYVEVNVTIPGDDGGRLLDEVWSSLHTVTMTHDKEALMARFRVDAVTTWQDHMKSLVEVHHRRRRAHAVPTKLTRDLKGYWMMTGLTENVNMKLKTFASPSGAISMVMVEHAGLLFWLVTSSYTLQNPGTLHVYMLHLESDVLQSTSVPTLGAQKCQPVLLLDIFIELVCVESLADQFPDKIRVTVMTSLEVYSSYDRLDSASFNTKHAMGVEAFTIQSRQFLVVANHHDDKGNPNIESEIFVYDPTRSRMQPFQRILTRGARDWVAFSFTSGPDAEYFLAVANEYTLDYEGNRNYAVESVIYRYEDNKFIPFQCIQTYGAREWAVYQGPQGELLLAVVNGQTGVAFYQYNGWTFVNINFKVSTAGAERVWIGSLPNTLNQVVVTVANPQDPTNRPLVFYTQWQYISPLADYHREARAWCESFTERIMGDDLAGAMVKAGICTNREESYTFTRHVTITGDLTVHYQGYVSQVDPITVNPEGIQVTDEITVSIMRVFNKLRELTRLERESRTQFGRSMRLYQPNLHGHKFSTLRITCRLDGGGGGQRDGCYVANLQVQEINGVDSTFNNAVWLHKDNGELNLTLSDVVITKGGTATVAFLSGPGLPLTPTSQLVTLTGSHTIVGEKNFGFIKVEALQVAGTVDGVVVDGNLLLTVGEQHLQGRVTMASLYTPSLHLYLLNDQPFTKFLDDLVLKDVSQNITGVHTVGGLEVGSELTVSGRVNGVKVPEDLYLRNGPDEVIYIPTTFVSVTADSIFIHKNLNDIQQVDGSLSVMVVDGEQVVSSVKVFTQLDILGHSTVALKVSGHYLGDFMKNVQQEFIQGLESGIEVKGSMIFHDDLQVQDDQLDGASLSRIRNSAIPLTATYIAVPLVFQGQVQLGGNVEVTDRLNGESVHLYVLTHGTHTFTNTITFKNGLRVEGDVTTGSMKPHDVGVLASQLVLRNKNQTIVQNLYFLQPVMADLWVTGVVLINGVDLNDVVTLTGTTTFTFLRVLTETRMSAVDVGHCGTVDGVVWTELFFSDSLRKNGGGSVQTLTGRFVYGLMAHSATGTDLGNWERRLVYKDTTEYIAGSLMFTGEVVVEVLTFGRDFDGVSAEEYSSGWLLKDGDQSLLGLNTLTNVKAAAVTFEGVYLQTVEWSRLLHMTAKVDEVTTIHSASFGHVYGKEIILSGTIQGWDLSVDALIASAETQKITGKKTFLSLVLYSGIFTMLKGMLVSNSEFDDPVLVNLQTLADLLALRDTVVYIDSLTVHGDVHFGRDVRLFDHLNDEDLTTLLEEFWLSDLPASVSVTASFNTVVLQPGVYLILRGLLNGVDVETLRDTVLLKECEGSQVLSGSFVIESLTVTRLDTYTLDSKDDWLSRALQNLLLTDGDQVISGVLTMQHLTAKASMLLNGTLNGLWMGRDFVIRGQPATISGNKVFLQDVTVVGDLSPRPYALVQGVDVSEFAKMVVMAGADGVYFIPGVTTFMGLRILQTLSVAGTVDGVMMSRNLLLMRDGEQTMSGVLTVSAAGLDLLAVLVNNSITILDHFFNDIDLERLRLYTVKTQGDMVITGAVVFLEVVTATEVWLVNHMINGYNITDLALCLLGQHIVHNMGNEMAHILEAAHDVKTVLSGAPDDLWYYQEQYLATPLHKLLPVQLSGELMVDGVDTLVGLDRVGGRVRIYNITTMAELYPAIPVVESTAAAGLGSGMLAVCSSTGLVAAPLGTLLTATYTQVGAGPGAGYGHVYLLSGGMVRLEAAFRVQQCRDLVVCLAVLEDYSSFTVMCKTPGSSFYLINILLPTTAVKGSWMVIGGTTFLMTIQEGSTTLPAHLHIYGYDSFESQMVMIHSLVMSGARSVSTLSRGFWGLVTVTRPHSTYLVGKVVIFKATPVANTLTLTLVQIETTPALHPFSFPFLHGATNRAMVAYTGVGLLKVYDDLPTLQLATPTLYASVYKQRISI
ncbi:Thrombospondin-type laminin G domain and EAR repeat-containing protein-like 1 [Homarus americanus]|uniref:Thrombospondin-type laminin G domain and EAR repeat-containing protein-like 1 n=1 Tax=Homarus americanus TaxID=6706 RepID=A0A8J5MNZ3_HOMAM|nr:Thrombospondin-type laminin G domain and EAR repeat-containing protein-like 1 [Homarus americanus]